MCTSFNSYVDENKESSNITADLTLPNNQINPNSIFSMMKMDKLFKEHDLSKFDYIIIIDDLCSYGGTFVGAIKAIETDLNIKSKNNWLVVTHAEEAMTQANIPNTFSKVFSTDSIATPSGAISMSSQEFDENHQFYVRPVLDIIEELNK